MEPNSTADDALLGQLEHGPLYRFADFASLLGVVPKSPGVDTIWDDEGKLVYAGCAGRTPGKKGLAGRLERHANGARSGNQFHVYVADHYLLPELTKAQIEAISDSRLSFDELVREKVKSSFGFRFVVVDVYTTALKVEKSVKNGLLRAGRPPAQPSALVRVVAGHALTREAALTSR